MRTRLWLSVLLCSGLFLSRTAAQEPAPSPADFPSTTLAALASAVPRIVILQVAKVDPEEGTITWNQIADLKGSKVEPTIVHQFDRFPAALRANVFGWATPGKLAVAFDMGSFAICIGNTWYTGIKAPLHIAAQSMNDGGRGCYVGPVPKLIEDLKSILAGQEVVVTIAATGSARTI